MESKCISIKECGPFMDLLKQLKHPLNQSIVDFLEHKECGFEDGYPKVCCSNLPKSLSVFKQNKPAATTERVDLTAKAEAINEAFALDDPFDFEFWDIFRKKRAYSKKDYSKIVEIR